MIIRGIKVGSRSALIAKRDGTVVWEPPIDVPTHSFPWSVGSRVMIAANNTSVELWPTNDATAGTRVGLVQSTRQRGTVLDGPTYNTTNTTWWYRVLWDDDSLPSINGTDGCWVAGNELVAVVENRAPVASTQAVVATVGTPVAITLAATDADGDALTYAYTNPSKGTLSGTAPNLTYTPATQGTDSFSFTASDGVLSSNTAIVSITNNPATPPSEDEPALLPQLGWSATATSAEAGFAPDMAIDGQDSTYWRSQFSPSPAALPQSLTIYLGAPQQVMGFTYLPRQSGTSGHIGEYQFYSSMDNVDWTLLEAGTWTQDATEKTVMFDGKTAARYVRLRAITGINNAASIGNLGVYVPKTDIVVVEPPPVDPGPITGTVMRSSVTQYGITWTFDKPYPVGQYCNGDYFVVGPIEELRGPVSNGTNGTMINPVQSFEPLQGFDSRMTVRPYSTTLNVGLTLPRKIYAGSSIISCLSHPELRASAQLDYQAVLTVVSQAPPAGSFRPSYFAGVDKNVVWNKANIDYTKLQNLPVLVQASRSYAEDMLEMPMFNLGGILGCEAAMAYYNVPIHGKNYGREIILGIARVGLELNLNYTTAEKELMAIRMIQCGLDIYGGNMQGLKLVANGGHMGGRKLAMAMAGLLLNDSAILARCDGTVYPDYFPEDKQHFYVTQQDVDLVPREAPHPLYPTLGPFPYTSEHLGMPEWSTRGGYPSNEGGSNWSRVYRNVVCPNFVGEMLAAKLSGLETLWNRPAFFDYTFNRAYPNYQNEGKLNSFVNAMCIAYANQAFGRAPNNLSQWPR